MSVVAVYEYLLPFRPGISHENMLLVRCESPGGPFSHLLAYQIGGFGDEFIRPPITIGIGEGHHTESAFSSRPGVGDSQLNLITGFSLLINFPDPNVVVAPGSVKIVGDKISGRLYLV